MRIFIHTSYVRVSEHKKFYQYSITVIENQIMSL